MKDLKIFYKNKKGVNLEIVGPVNQYVFLEPNSYAIVRYTIKDDGIEVGGKLSNEVKETDVISVKFIVPKTEFLSKKSDFDGVDERTNKVTTLDLVFNDDGVCLYDALYTNLTDEKIKVKVSAYDKADVILENEHSYIDAPDGFIRTVGVTIDSTGVEYTLLFRRSGRVTMHPAKASYEEMARLVKDVIFAQDRYYSQVPKPTRRYIEEHQPTSIIDTLILEGWEVGANSITRKDYIHNTTIHITDEELGEVIRTKITLKDLTNLFKPVDLAGNGHRFIDQAKNLVLPCDHTCSLAEVTPKLITDNRG